MTYQARRHWMKEVLASRQIWPTAQETMQQFPGLSKSAAYRDLDAVAREVFKDVNVERIRFQVLSRLNQRIPQLADRDLVRLAIAFLPQKVEQKTEVESKGKEKVGIVELLRVWKPVAEQAIALERGRDASRNNR